MPPPRAAALTIAGSDSGGGAGIQADLKTFAAFGVYGTAAITAVTAQNTLGVHAVSVLPPEIVVAQAEAVLGDIRPRAAKTGMLATAAIVRAVATLLDRYPQLPVVVDPVTHAKSGDPLLDPEALAVVRDELLPRAAVVTPNLPEATALVGFPVEDEGSMLEAALRLLDRGARAVIVKGGHRRDCADDLFVDGATVTWLRGTRVETRCTHGTGCTFSAAIAAGLAQGLPPLVAAQRAKTYLTAALRAGYEVGAGHSPVHHLYALEAVPSTAPEGATP